MAFSSFEDLKVRLRSCRLSLEIYKSIRECTDFARFLKFAVGSNAELRTQLYLAKELTYLPAEIAKLHLQETNEIAAMLRGLIQSLEN